MADRRVPGELFVVSAPSGGGKTSLTRAAIDRLAVLGHRAMISVSYTTRAPRPGEVDGEHYHFVDRPRFDAMVGDGAFLEHADVFGNGYGTGRDATRRQLDAGVDVFLDIDWQGGRQIREALPERTTGVFVLPPSAAELERRLRGRGQDDDTVIGARMAQARDEMSHWDEYDYVIVNDDFDRACDELVRLVRARRLRRDVQARAHAALIDELLAISPPDR